MQLANCFIIANLPLYVNRPTILMVFRKGSLTRPSLLYLSLQPQLGANGKRIPSMLLMQSLSYVVIAPNDASLGDLDQFLGVGAGSGEFGFFKLCGFAVYERADR